MRLTPFFVILLFNLVLSQNLVFTNNQETIIFKKNELININGQKYLYQKAVKNKTQIHLIKSEFLRKENITIDTSKIETFRTHKVRFSERNALTKGLYGLKSLHMVAYLVSFRSQLERQRRPKSINLY